MFLELDSPMLPVALAELPLELEQKATAKPIVFLDPHEPQALESTNLVVTPTVGLQPQVLAKPQNVDSSELITVKKDPQFLGIKASRWTTVALGMAAVDLVLRDPILMSIGVFGGLAKLAYPHLQKVGGQKRKLQLAMVGGVATVAALGLHLQISSAQALFFQEAENFLSSTFDLSGDAVGTIFNVFRAVYVVYLIYSAISIWTAYNRDEDWMSVAKAPIVIFVGGTLIDAVTTIITA